MLHLLFVAGKYILEGLADQCTAFLENNMAINNVCTILTHAMIYSQQQLVKDCVEFISENTDDVVKSEEFLNLSEEALHKILSNDNLTIITETLIFEGCIKWAVNKNKDQNPVSDEWIRHKLGRCLFLIRFSDMTAKEFAGHVGARNILTSDEKNAFFCMMLTKENANAVRTLGFCVKNRKGAEKPPNLCVCYSSQFQNEMEQRYVQNITRMASHEWHELLTVRVNKPTIFKGVSIDMRGAPAAPVQIDISLRLDISQGFFEDQYQQNATRVMWTSSSTVSGQIESCIPVYSENITLDANKQYIIEVQINILLANVPCKLNSNIVTQSLSFIFSNDSSPRQGRIHGLYYD